MKIRTADYIATRLREWGVDTVFMLSGGGMMHLVDSVGRADGLNAICNHHEQCSAIAADALARLTRRVGVCYATSGPGATNILTGLVGAWQDSSPVLFVTGQSKSTQTIQGSGIAGLRQFGTFEVDIVPIVKPVTKYAVMVSDPKTIRYHLEKAFHLATTGRPGPVLLDLPLDVQGALIEPENQEGYVPEDVAKHPSTNDLAKVVDILRNAKRPLILSGVGIRAAGAVEVFRRLIDRMHVPVVTSQLGKDALYYDHPLFVGHSGPKGDRAGNFAIQTADVILSLGCSLHSQTTGWENSLFAPDAVKIQVDIDEAVLVREQLNVNLKIKSDVSEFLLGIEPLIGVGFANDAWRNNCLSWKTRYAVNREPHDRMDGAVNYYDFAEALSCALKGHECIVTDAGSAFYAMGQGFRAKEEQRFISSGSLGAMGFALPAANGVATASDTATICVTGDGSLMTNIHDLAVTSHYKLNVKIFVLNNEGYLSIRNTQRDFFNGMFVGTDADSGVFIPELESQAKTYRLPYLRCEGTANLNNVIDQALAIEGPVLIEIKALRDQRMIPSVMSERLPDGRMQSKPLHEMYPYLPQSEVDAELENARKAV
ncbi:MAG: thiamine pyrophosphate-binding protein [Candidatus Paracaedibacteraceae bacterium]|nr:thiamine pyrophosphate-binding protein [Candidatus Paracaedibacteraceae bacterium]